VAAGSLPAARKGDCYLMRNILHDWTDAQSIQILRNLRTAFGTAAATLAIVEVGPSFRLSLDCCAEEGGGPR